MNIYSYSWCGLIRKSLFILFINMFFVNMASAKFIAVSSPTESDNFRSLIMSNIEATVDSSPGNEVYIDYANNDFDLQYKQIKSYVNAGADAIIIISTGNESQNHMLFEFAKQVPLIFINTEPVPNLSTMPPNTLYVGSNELESGTLQMEELARLANYRGRVALLIGEESHSAAKKRTQDVKDVLAKYPNMQLVVSKSGNWQRNQGYSIVSGWIKQKIDFDILVANNDEMILGGIQALSDAGLDPNDYLTGGIDATYDALAEIDKGILDVTVLQDAIGQAKASVEASFMMMNGEAVPNPHWVPFRLVTKENYHEFMNR